MELNNRISVPELLAPAGSLAHLKAAIHAGADAVYMGGQRFGARAYAENFSEDQVVEALRYAHFYNRRLYLTVNTLVKESEMDSLYEFLAPYYEAGLDGVIVQDLGVASYIQKAFPGMEIHGSTQMTITDVSGALAAKRFGMTRVVPARELSYEEIRRIRQETGLEVEVFAHGALCYCYSGQCLFSSTYGGRSGNRGRCAQPCRLAYDLKDPSGKKIEKNKHILSPKDLCALSELEELCRCGVDSLKIEGRMKNVEYVAGVTECYRKELDRIKAGLPARPKELEESLRQLEELYCREAFTEGYFDKHNGQDMMAVHYPKNLGHKIGTIKAVAKFQITIALDAPLVGQDVLVIPVDSQNEIVLTVPSEGAKGKQITLRIPKGVRVYKGMEVYRRRSEALISRINQEYVEKKPCYFVKCQAVFRQGSPAEVRMTCQDQEIMVQGQLVEAASKRSVTKEDVIRQFSKTGNVPFQLGDCEIDLEDGCFYPMSWMKELRQQAYAMLEEKMSKRQDRRLSVVEDDSYDNNVASSQKEESDPLNPSSIGSIQNDSRIASVYSMEQLEYVLEKDFFTGYTLACEFWKGEELAKARALVKECGCKVYYGMPRIYRQEKYSRRLLEEVKGEVLSGEYDGIYVYNINESELVREIWHSEVPLIFAASLYQWNTSAIDTYDTLYGSHVCELPIENSVGEWERLMELRSNHSFEMLVYGRYPVMLSAQCVKATFGRCNHKKEVFYLTDQKERQLPVTTCCDGCYNIIWRDTPRDIREELAVASHTSQATIRKRYDLFLLSKKEIDAFLYATR